MKKIVCAACGLVNLDKFVSFPHCAACGARLPQQEPARWRSFWRRPVRPIYWMLAVGSGLALLGLAIANVASETRDTSDKPLPVGVQIPRSAAPGQTVTVRLTPGKAQQDNAEVSFKSVRLRLGHETRSDFSAISIQPAPTTIETRGSGEYYLWDELPHDAIIRLALTPRAGATGNLQVRATLWVASYQPFEVRASIQAPVVARPKMAPAAPMQSAPNVAR